LLPGLCGAKAKSIEVSNLSWRLTMRSMMA
jgi:hypothetical protein